MIEKMKFLSITGPKEDIDRVIDTYLSKYEIHLENALSELKTVKDLRPYIEINPYRDTYQRAAELVELLPATAPKTRAMETRTAHLFFMLMGPPDAFLAFLAFFIFFSGAAPPASAYSIYPAASVCQPFS